MTNAAFAPTDPFLECLRCKNFWSRQAAANQRLLPGQSCPLCEKVPLYLIGSYSIEDLANELRRKTTPPWQDHRIVWRMWACGALLMAAAMYVAALWAWHLLPVPSWWPF